MKTKMKQYSELKDIQNYLALIGENTYANKLSSIIRNSAEEIADELVANEYSISNMNEQWYQENSVATAEVAHIDMKQEYLDSLESQVDGFIDTEIKRRKELSICQLEDKVDL